MWIWERLKNDRRGWLAAYLALLAMAACVRPLTMDETLQLVATTQRSFGEFWKTMAQTPGGAPAGYVTQFSFLSALGQSVVASRLGAVAFAMGAAYLFYRIAAKIPLQRPVFALLLFIMLPAHYGFASEGRPFEQALFFMLLATLGFYRLLEQPGWKTSGGYAMALAACVYTEPAAYLPATGYLLSLFLFVKAKEIRRALWWALPATVAPAILYLPYAFWAQRQANSAWIFSEDHYALRVSTALQMVRDLTVPAQWTGYVLSIVLLVGAGAGVWRCFQLSAAAGVKRIRLCCLAGGAVSTVVLIAITDVATGSLFSASQIFWAVPGVVLLSGAAMDWLMLQQGSNRRAIGWGLGIAAAILCVAGDISVLLGGAPDLRKAIGMVKPELTGDSCVVFTSQGLSKPLFGALAPGLTDLECRHFLHRRIVLASHPYVRPDQQADAESFLRGLNFVEVKRNRVGGSEVLVFDQQN